MEENNMPNHTINDVDIHVNTGEDKEIFALAELKTKLKISKNKFDFEAIIPMPKDLHKALEVEPFTENDEWTHDGGHLVPKSYLIRRKWVKQYGFDNWYDWSIDNWGTKWNAIRTCVELNDGSLYYTFDTAWDCPREIVNALMRMRKTILKDIKISWECIHEDGYEEETIIDIDFEGGIDEQTS